MILFYKRNSFVHQITAKFAPLTEIANKALHIVRQTARRIATHCLVGFWIVAGSKPNNGTANRALFIVEEQPLGLVIKGLKGQRPSHIRTACVARGNGVGKFSAAAWMDTPEVPRNSGLLPALGRHTARDATEPPVGDSLGGSRYQARPALIFAALALTGCATHPLTRSCLTQAQYEQMKAAEPAKVHGKLTGKADADIRPITGSAIELRAWGEAELGLLSICAAPVNSTEGK